MHIQDGTIRKTGLDRFLYFHPLREPLDAEVTFVFVGIGYNGWYRKVYPLSPPFTNLNSFTRLYYQIILSPSIFAASFILVILG
jgi:hypothetical protein